MLIAIPVLRLFDARNSRRAAARTVARNIFDQREKLLATVPAYCEVSPRDFPALDAAFYDKTTHVLEAEGFSKLGDIADAAFNEVTGLDTFVRVMIDESGSIVANFVDVYKPQ